MPLVNPDTSQAPLWRFPPRKREYPITAYRCWEVGTKGKEILLRSLAAEFFWESPVVRSDAPPVDPKQWDKLKHADYNERVKTIAHTLNIAGIWAVLDKKLAVDVCMNYNAQVIGEVHLWGRVARFKLGYRAEFCMIMKLWLVTNYISRYHPKMSKIVDALERLYDCDVTVIKIPRDILK